MKRIILTITLLLSLAPSFANTIIGLWGGAGIANHYNYDLGTSAGFNIIRGVSYRFGIGAHIFMQGYNLYYDKENTQLTGASIRYKSNYAFVAPAIDIHLGQKGNTHFYINAGVGFNMGATDTLHKWYNAGTVHYDSALGNASNINSMVVRFGMGLTEYFSAGNRFHLTLTEDLGFLANKLSKTTDVTDIKLKNNVDQLYRPMYISLRLGIGWNFKRR